MHFVGRGRPRSLRCTDARRLYAPSPAPPLHPGAAELPSGANVRRGRLSQVFVIIYFASEINFLAQKKNVLI